MLGVRCQVAGGASAESKVQSLKSQVSSPQSTGCGVGGLESEGFDGPVDFPCGCCTFERMNPIASLRRRVFLWFGLLLAPMLLAAWGAEEGSGPRVCYWVFLNKGSARQKISEMSKEEVAKLQADHIGNLGALYKQGRAFTAGPLGDNGFIRGTVVLNISGAAEVKECFKPDPFVQQDILSVEAYRWLTDTTKFGKPDEPVKLAKHTLVVVKKGPAFGGLKGSASPDFIARLLPSLAQLAEGDGVVISGPLVGAGELLGVALVSEEDGAKVEAALGKDPAVKEGRVKLELHPQLLAAGVLRKSG